MLLLLLACADPGDLDSDTHVAGDTAADTATDADTDTDTDADTDTDTGSTLPCDVAADGTAAFTDIQLAVDAASDGDTIRICAGTYRSVAVSRASLTLEGVDGADVTVIDGGAEPALTVDGVTVSVSGVTFTGSPGALGTAQILADRATVTVTRSRFADATCDAADSSYGIHTTSTAISIEDSIFENNALQLLVYPTDGSSLTLRHDVFRDNAVPADGVGGLLVSLSASDAEISNNAFVRNTANFSSALIEVGGAGVSDWVYNNLVWGNDNQWPGLGAVVVRASAVFENNVVSDNTGFGVYGEAGATVEYNDAAGNSGSAYTGAAVSATNLSADPRMADPAAGDYTLDAGFSPCIDAGDPLPGYNDVDGSRNDMGVLGGPGGV